MMSHSYSDSFFQDFFFLFLVWIIFKVFIEFVFKAVSSVFCFGSLAKRHVGS